MSKERRTDWMVNPTVVRRIKEGADWLDKINRFCHKLLQSVFVDYFPIFIVLLMLFLLAVSFLFVYSELP